MTNPSWARLVRMYERSIARLLNLDLFQHPELADEPEFREATWRVAQAMVREASVANARSWREAAMRGTNSRAIYRALQAEIATGRMGPELRAMAIRNAQLIQSLPQDISRIVTARSAKMAQEGGRPDEVESIIRSLTSRLSKSRVKLIARTEVGRAETDLTQVRAERIGLTHYQWSTSRDSRVRPSHKNLDGVLIAWNDPPAPEQLIGEPSKAGHYAPGCIWNCRCLALPLADLNEVTWPAKVYGSGSIRRMTRAEFSRMTEVQIAA